jgi:hypothetical protein
MIYDIIYGVIFGSMTVMMSWGNNILKISPEMANRSCSEERGVGAEGGEITLSEKEIMLARLPLTTLPCACMTLLQL